MDVDKFRRLADFVCRDEYIHSCFLFTLNGHFPAILSFFVLYVVWFLWLIQPCTHKHLQFVKQITVLVVPHWKELSTIRFEKKAGVNAEFASSSQRTWNSQKPNLPSFGKGSSLAPWLREGGEGRGGEGKGGSQYLLTLECPQQCFALVFLYIKCMSH